MSNHKVVLGTLGEEDYYLKIGATNTFFKNTYKTHSNFSSNWSIIANNCKPSSYTISSFQPNSKLYFRFPFQGDIIINAFIRFKIIDNKANSANTLHANIDDGMGEFTALSLINKIELLDKNKILSVLDKSYLSCFYKLSCSSEKYMNFQKMTSFNNNPSIYDKSLEKYVRYCMLPIPFWFTSSEGLGLPMWALTNPTIGLNIELANYDQNNISPGNTNNNNFTNNIIFDIELLVNNIYLNNVEKNLFKENSLEYYIDQTDIIEKIELSGN